MGTGSDLWNAFQTPCNQRDWTQAASLFVTDGVYIIPSGRLEGPEAIAAFLAAGGKATSDSKDETSMLIENGDRVVAVWTNRATLTGTIPKADGTEIAVTGTTLKHSGVTVGTVRDGKFATMRDYLDTGDIVRQLGLAPST